MSNAMAEWLAADTRYLLLNSVWEMPKWALLAGGLLLAGAWLWWRLFARLNQPVTPAPGLPADTSDGGQQENGLVLEKPTELPSPAQLKQLLATLRYKATRVTATDSLLALGNAVLPALQEGLLLSVDEQQAHRLAQLGARLGSPAARQALLAVVQSPNLVGRAAALRALSNFASVPTDAPLFQRVVEQELRLAQQLLHGMVGAAPSWQAALRYELRRSLQRLFGLLLQLYERPPILAVQRSVAHFANERQASYWQALENLLPRPLYQGLYALLGEGRVRYRVQVFDDLLGPLASAEAVPTLVVRHGTTAFSTWTINEALRQWHPQPGTVALLYPHLMAPNALVREEAWEILGRLPVQRPAAYDQLITDYPDVAELLAASPGLAVGWVSAREQVLLLKAMPLFSETPENVLADIVPISREVFFQAGQEVFAKGAFEASLYIIGEGEVQIFNGPRQLASFGKGDFFGELALLDAEPRSATAVAHTPTVAFRLDQEDFYDMLETRPEVLHTIMRALCQRLRRQNEKSKVVIS